MKDRTPIKMLHDRVLVEVDRESGERRSSGGIVIPATAAMGDHVLFDPEEKAEVEVSGEVYVVMRERDIHAVAADRLADEATGLYL